MLKKFIVLICTLSFLTLLPNMVSAAQTDKLKADILKGLGIVTQKKVSRDSFIDSLETFLYEDTSMFSAEEIARQTGMISEDTEYKGREKISVSEAIKYAVVVLGYKVQAEKNGNYTNTAAGLGLLKGLSATGDDTLSYNDSIALLYNMLEVAPMRKEIKEMKVNYIIDSDTNLLEANRGIYKIRGIVTADTKTSLYSDAGRYKTEYVLINDVQYFVGSSNSDLFLGHNVVAYVKENNYDEWEIVYIYDQDGKNDILEITAENIEYVADDFSYIEYSDEEKVKKVKLDVAPAVIYNGVSYGAYTVDDLMPDIGRIAMIDNDGNGKYDVVKVTSYETMVVSWINAEEYTIRNKYEFEGCISELKIEDIDDTSLKVYDDEGKETKFNQITAGRVISVAKSKDGSVIKINISSDEGMAGHITQTGEDEIIIDGVEYRRSKDFDNYLADKSMNLTPGKKYVFYTDYFGNIVYADNIIDKNYMFVKQAYEGDDGDSYYVTYMNMEGEWYTAPIAKKVKVDENRISDNEAFKLVNNNKLQIMKVSISVKGEINEIDIAELSDSYTEDTFSVIPEATYVYRIGPNSFNMTFFPTSDAVVVVIPQNPDDKAKYSVKPAGSYFIGDKNYPVTFYGVDEFNCVPVITIAENEENIITNMNKNMFVVTKISQKWIDNEVLPQVEGYVGMYKNMTVIGSEENTFDGIKRGDIININYNARGKADFVLKVTPTNTTGFYQTAAFVKGTVLDLDFEKKMIKFQNGSVVSCLRLPPTTSVIFYDRVKNECRNEQAIALKAGDEIVLRVSGGNIREIVCYE